MVLGPFWLHKNIFSCWPFLGMFWPSSLNPMKTCQQTCIFYHTFQFMLFILTFPLKYYLFNKDYFLLIYMFMGMIRFWRSIHLSFQNHQMCTFSAGLGTVRNRDRLSWIYSFSIYLNFGPKPKRYESPTFHLYYVCSACNRQLISTV